MLLQDKQHTEIKLLLYDGGNEACTQHFKHDNSLKMLHKTL